MVARVPAPSITGTDIRNEKRAAAGRSKFLIIPPLMVDPEREIPGRREIAWNKPMIKVSIQEMVSICRIRLPTNSAITNKRRSSKE